LGCWKYPALKLLDDVIFVGNHPDTKSNEKILIHKKQVIKEEDIKW
jgi:hypothetical protein